MNDPVVIQAQIDATNAGLAVCAAQLVAHQKQNAVQVAQLTAQLQKLEAQLAAAQTPPSTQ